MHVSIADIALGAAIPFAVTCVAIVLNLVIPAREFMARAARVTVPATANVELLLGVVSSWSEPDDQVLSIDAKSFEQIRRTEYIVQPGDTFSEIAAAFDLETYTLLSVNSGIEARRLLPGTKLYIPDRDGILIAVMEGDSIWSIANEYGISQAALVDANDIQSPDLQVGESLFVPGAKMEETAYLLAIGELFRHPVQSYLFTSGFGMRIDPIDGILRMHNGIDLANRIGTSVTAGLGGRVIVAENQGNYGNMVMIDHGNGFRTLYGHLDRILVSVGQWVGVGERIGTIGNTGRSTGPHLHFSVFRGRIPVDPLDYMPR